MGVYTNINRVGTSIPELDVKSTYVGEAGAIQAMIESVNNEHLMFEYAIASDAREITLIAEGGVAEDIMNESAEGFFAKAKEYLKKIWEKIKAILSSFVTMIKTVLIKDNKELVKKFELEVKKKDLSKMKYKWADLKAGDNRVMHSSDLNLSAAALNISTELKKVIKNDLVKNHDEAGTSKIKSSEFKEELLKKYNLEYGNLFDSFKELYYKEEDEKEGLDSALLNDIMDTLTTAKNTIKDMEDKQKEIDKIYKDAIKNLENQLKDPKEDQIGVKYGLAVNEVARDVVASMITTDIQVTKWRIRECRALFAKAARYNPKLVKENAELDEAYDQIERSIVDEAFEGIYI